MGVPNREGVAVDPVPFIVIAGLTVLLVLSFGPLYGQALAMRLSSALAGSVGLSVIGIAITYHRQIWTVRPEIESELPAGLRAERLFHLMVVLTVVIVALATALLV